MPPKIICIGFQKTGTTSLERALNILGYSVKGNTPRALIPVLKGDMKKVLRIAGDHDAVADKPWFMMYKELDQALPGSKFILTLREPDSWYRSVSRHLGELRTPMHEWIYGRGKGLPKDHQENALAVFTKHYNEVKDYFAERPQDLLVLDLSEGSNWEKLCAFLGKEVPQEPFPHLMKGSANKDYKDNFRMKFKYRRRQVRNYLLIKYIDFRGYW